LHVATPDRSVHDAAFSVHGTLQKTPVTPGAELISYGGFSDSNYLEQPYNAQLNFGIGDFCFIGWIKTQSTGNQKIFTRDADSNNRFQIYSINGGTGLYTQHNTDRSYYISNKFTSDGLWHQFCCARRDGVLEVYIDGERDLGSTNKGTINVPRNIDSTSAKSRVGNAYTYGIDSWDGEIALLRASKTVPTAEQIEKIYQDERELFKPDSRATLFGTSDTITAIAQQDDNILHVGTNQGKSVFNKLTRVDHHDTPINSIIETNGEFTIEQ